VDSVLTLGPDAFEEKDAETRKELQEEQERLQTEISRLQTESQSLATDYNQKLAYFEDVMRKRTEEEQRLQARITELTAQLERSSGDTAHLREEIEHLKKQKNKGGCCIQ
jgi:predicted RNase H-like nuclease (RuvC/YqgF family)